MIEGSLARHAPAKLPTTVAHEVHHAAPRCLLRLHDATDGSIPDPDVSAAWFEFEHECQRWNIPVTIARADLEALVEASTVVLDREKHRLIHQGDFARWGRRGGQQTVRRYGREHFRLLARHRWGDPDALPMVAARMSRRRDIR